MIIQITQMETWFQTLKTRGTSQEAQGKEETEDRPNLWGPKTIHPHRGESLEFFCWYILQGNDANENLNHDTYPKISLQEIPEKANDKLQRKNLNDKHHNPPNLKEGKPLEKVCRDNDNTNSTIINLLPDPNVTRYFYGSQGK